MKNGNDFYILTILFVEDPVFVNHYLPDNQF